ncbi:MAG: TRAP transporter large permease subunit, partial [Anaerolineales bacterium]|nr:TRAP transporter large permease subunit [Anaerolineales bacterium]
MPSNDREPVVLSAARTPSGRFQGSLSSIPAPRLGAAVVKAAVVPAIAIYVALFYIVHLEACKLGLKGISRSELPNFFRTLASGLHFLLPLAVLIYELVVVRHSPDLAAFR